MFDFRKLEVVHWDYWQRFTLPLDSSIITVVGPNGSGKTTLLDALRTLLTIECSSGRDYRRYVRRHQFSWLRAVVGNQRSVDGRYPFFPLTEDRVTLVCRVRKKGGEWLRQYAIEPGEQSIEALEQKADWLNLRDYRVRLEGAGLTHAIKHVLALEQGETDKLCEYTPKRLLELVFSVFGDQEVLDNYQHAKNEQVEIARELTTLETELAALGTRLQQADAEVNSYLEWRHLKDERLKLESEWLPRVELAERYGQISGGRKHLVGTRRESLRLTHEYNELASRCAALEFDIAAQHSLREKNAKRVTEADVGFTLARKRYEDAERTLKDRDRLQILVRAQEKGVDLTKLAREMERDRQRVAELQHEYTQNRLRTQELQAHLRALQSGDRVEPEFVRAFGTALTQAKIAHRFLPDIVDVRDAQWHGAVEAVLAPFRHVVLLENAGDRRAAWECGQRLRYRHFIVAERAAAPKPKTGSLLDVVRFTAQPPVWLAHLLNDIQRVASVEQGSALADDQSWITADGYHRERRGGRHIGVEAHDFHFGAAARERQSAAMAQELTKLQARDTQIEQERAQLSARIADTQSLLNGKDAALELSARAPEFAAVEPFIDTWRDAAQNAAFSLAEAKKAENTARDVIHDCEKRLSGLAVQREQAQRAAHQARGDYRRQHAEIRAKIHELQVSRRAAPAAWYAPTGIIETREKYESARMILREIERLDERLMQGRWIEDERVLLKRDKLLADHQRLDGNLKVRRAHHERALQITGDARAAYINVLRATVRQYARNAKTLGELAGIVVELEPPHLENDDVVLSQAGLIVKFSFDDKGMIGLNDGEASGGQQVMKSLILLIALMMDDARPGGFVFIDEPFAHLDIFNIDKVGAFLEATRAQYIVTTPNTHNVNVFKPSDLTLVTGKRKHPSPWAPPVAFLRRDRATDKPFVPKTVGRQEIVIA